MNKKFVKNTLVASLLSISFITRSQIITTIAGNGTIGYSGDGGPAIAAELSNPVAVALDASGNIYIADRANKRIRKVNTSGIISTILGNGIVGYSGDGGQATDAEINYPQGVAIDIFGNLYVADANNSRIRKVNTSGIVSTFTGNGTGAYSGDGGQATAAEIYYPQGIATDAFGNIYIADSFNNRIRKIDTSGIITTIAGNGTGGYSGDGGQATAAEIRDPCGLTVDSSGGIYITDVQNNCIRIVNTSGIINTIAGNNVQGYWGDGGQATDAELDVPFGVAFDASGNVYVEDTDNNRMRIVSSGIITTFAGNGYAGYSGDGGPATDAEIHTPGGIELDVSGNIYFVDIVNNRIRKITSISTGSNNFASTSNEIAIYPIPTTGSVTISGISLGQVIELYNHLGQNLSSTIADNTIMQFDISNYPNGIYLIRIVNKDGSVVTEKKIIKTE